MEVEMHSYLLSGDIREMMVLVELAPEPPVYLPLAVIVAAVLAEWLGEAQCKIFRPRPRPAVGLPPAGNQCIIHHCNECPDILVLIIIDAAHQVQDDMGL